MTWSKLIHPHIVQFLGVHVGVSCVCGVCVFIYVRMYVYGCTYVGVDMLGGVMSHALLVDSL